MEKKAVLITGGAIRVGRALALSLAKKGYDIAIHYNSSKKPAQSLAKEITKEFSKVRVEIFQADLSKSNTSEKLINAVFKKFPHLTVLINNASIFEPENFLQVTQKSFDANYNINLKAPFFLSQLFAKRVLKNNDTKNYNIINLLDSFITRTSEKYFVYLLTKKNLSDLTKMLARSLAPKIRVNGICLGITELSQKNSDAYLEKRIASLPKKQKVKLEELANTLNQILENQALIGNLLFVDNGEQLV
ncbi:MAG: SDR family NAD(P)-dependent oxidoreductase [Alphaproteobacteria bacterium]|jgi:pteridine reductase